MAKPEPSDASVGPWRSVVLLLLVVGPLVAAALFWPKDGLRLAGIHWELPNPETFVYGDSIAYVDLEAQAEKERQDSIRLSSLFGLKDSLDAYQALCDSHPARIYLPQSRKDLLFDLFDRWKLLESGVDSSLQVRIMHYGDSQIEGDRISNELRRGLQARFGGLGSGLLPLEQPIGSATVSQSLEGKAYRYILWGSNPEFRAEHRRYGPMLSLGVIDSSLVVWRASKGYDAPDSADRFSSIRLLIGQNDSSGVVRLSCSTGGGTKELAAGSGPEILHWDLSYPAQRAELSFEGVQGLEVLGISLESRKGVVVDNLGMRGCSGTIFSQADASQNIRLFSMLDPDLIMLAFGGNIMPYLTDDKVKSRYVGQLLSQISYLQSVAPEVPILFVGPSDMSTLEEGKRVSFPMLGPLRDALRDSMLAHGVAYFDQLNAMGGLQSMPSWVDAEPALAVSDYIHFTRLGAQKMGEMITESLLREYTLYGLKQRMLKERDQAIEEFEVHN